MQPGATNKFTLLALRRQYAYPHKLYNALREHDSLYFDETSQSWLVTGHAVITTILDDPRFISGLGVGVAASTTSLHMSSVSKQMIFMDGEHHRRVQEVMLRPLALMVKNMPSTIRQITQNTLKPIYQHGKMEAVSDLASPISLLTIAHVLGIPAHNQEELSQLERWSDTFGDVTSGHFRGNMQDVQDLENYFRHLIAKKRQTLSDDLLSAFIEAGDVFPEEEDLVANCMMVFAAGRITTKKLLGNGISLMMQEWERLQTALQENPRFPHLLGEELLRMITPTRYLMRQASEDVDLSPLFPGEHMIQRGQRLLLFLEAANYDPAVFSHPEQFYSERRPNKHIAFGYGPHQCPGATLARAEIQIALEEMLSLPHPRPEPGTSPVWNSNANLGGFVSNPVVFG